MPTRGCGTRIAGGIYLCVPKGPNGMPVEYFLIDPPRKLEEIDLIALGIAPQGMSLTPDGDVIDWIGENHYPNVWDFVAETKHLGMSRRIPSTFDFTQIKPGSMLYALHPRGWIEDADARALLGACSLMGCPKCLPEHHHTIWKVGAWGPMCIGLHRQCVTGGEETTGAADPRIVRRTIGDTTYVAYRAPESVNLSFSPALIAAFPIHHIEVVRDLEKGSHEGAAGKAAKSGFNVEVVHE